MGIKVNMSENEAKSASLEVLPAGKYLVAVSDGKLMECGPESKNPGKPYYNMELTIQSDKYEGRKLFTNVMCFNGALYSLSQILKASGVAVDRNGAFQVPEHEENEIPELDWFIGREYVVRVAVQAANRGKDGKDYPERNEIKGWLSAKTDVTASTGATNGAAKKDSLLP